MEKKIDWFICNRQWVLTEKVNVNWLQNFTPVIWPNDLGPVIYTLWACFCIYLLPYRVTMGFSWVKVYVSVIIRLSPMWQKHKMKVSCSRQYIISIIWKWAVGFGLILHDVRNPNPFTLLLCCVWLSLWRSSHGPRQVLALQPLCYYCCYYY